MTQLANCFSLLIKLLYTCATRAIIVIIGRHSAAVAAAGEQCAAWLAVLIDRLCVPTECAEIDTARGTSCRCPYTSAVATPVRRRRA